MTLFLSMMCSVWLLLVNVPPAHSHEPQCLVPVERVIDGDTFVIGTLTVFGPDVVPVVMSTSIRLMRVDTPERGQPQYQEAKNMLTAFVQHDVHLEIIGRDNFGRWLSEVFICDSDGALHNVNDALIKEGWKWNR